MVGAMTAWRWTATLLAGAAVAGIVGWRGLVHVADPAGFAVRMDAYRIVDPAWTGFLSRWLAWCMCAAAGLALLPGTWREVGRWILLGVLAVFLAAMAVA